MAAIDIERSLVSGTEFSSKINESVEMYSPILVMLSTNDALRSKRAKQVNNAEGVEGPALTVGEDDIAELKLWGRHESIER